MQKWFATKYGLLDFHKVSKYIFEKLYLKSKAYRPVKKGFFYKETEVLIQQYTELEKIRTALEQDVLKLEIVRTQFFLFEHHP